MTPEIIRKLTNDFVKFTKKTIRGSADLANVAIGLKRHEDGWELVAVQKPVPRREYVTVVELPDDIGTEPLDDAMIDLAGAISRKLTASSTIINSNLKRTAEKRSEIGRTGGRNRWK